MPDFTDCPCTGQTLSKLLHPAILATLSRGERHGYEICDRLAGLATLGGQRPDVSGVYRALKSMEAGGFVTGSWGPSQRGPAKRLYRLTASGRRCLARWAQTLADYRIAVGALFRMVKRACAPRKG